MNAIVHTMSRAIQAEKSGTAWSDCIFTLLIKKKVYYRDIVFPTVSQPGTAIYRNILNRSFSVELSPAFRKILTVALAVIGIGTIWYYLQCSDSCAYLKGGIFGIDLKYIGIPFMAFVILAALAGWSGLLRIILAAGIGGEFFLIGYQISQSIFCPYCLVFALTLILAFAVNHRRTALETTGWRKFVYLLGDVQVRFKGVPKTVPLSLATVSGFLAFVLAFTGSPVPVYAAESPLPIVYGSGPAEVRLYSDYFCFPCQTLEDDAEALLGQVIARRKARILFVDTPIHKETALYARYFLYATWSEPGYERAEKARKALFSAAKDGIGNETELMNYLKAKGIKTVQCPTTDYFNALTDYLKKDRVDSTPTCVIVTPEGKRTYDSRKSILAALKILLEK